MNLATALVGLVIVILVAEAIVAERRAKAGEDRLNEASYGDWPAMPDTTIPAAVTPLPAKGSPAVADVRGRATGSNLLHDKEPAR